MTTGRICDILDANVRRNSGAVAIMVVVAGLGIALGLSSVFHVKEGHSPLGGYIIAGCSGIFFLGGVIGLTVKADKKVTAYAKEVLVNDPAQLKWIYKKKVYRGGTLLYTGLVMEFRNGKNLFVDEKAMLPDKIDSFMIALRELNPAVIMGY